MIRLDHCANARRRRVSVALLAVCWPSLLLSGLDTCASEEGFGALRACGLRCEYRSNPLGVDERRPRLSWRLTSDQRGQVQSAYQIQVASTFDFLGDGHVDLWDTGAVESSQQLGVAYAGKPLAAGQRCWWRVRAWDQQGVASPWSQPAWWETGMLEPEAWQAQWIEQGKPLPVRDEDYYRDDPAPLFRKEFHIDRPVREARLYVAGLGYCLTRINGHPIGARQLDPGWTNYNQRVLYSTFDVTDLLAQGGNALAAIVGNGWFHPLPLRMWGRINLRDHLPVGRPRLVSQLVIDFEDGTRQVVSTDASWKVADGPILRNNVYLGEVYDARREKPGWDRPGFDDSAWRPSVVCEGKLGPLQAQPQPPVRAVGQLSPKGISQPTPGVFIFDMGENFAGWVRLKVKGPAGTRVKLRYGELLHKDGSLNVMTSVCGQIKQAGVGGPGASEVAHQGDTYVLRGEGVETYTPSFTFHAFRYVEVTGFPGQPTAESLEGVVLSADVDSAGTFACSNPLLNDIQAMCRRTFRSNLFSVQSDCPHRERFGYGGDIVASSDALILNYDMAQFYAKSIVDFADAVQPNGGLPETAPYVGISAGGFGDQSGPIGWALAHPLLLCQLHRYYGDDRLIETQYPVAAKWLELVADQTPNHIVGRGIGDHESLETTPLAITSTAFYYQAARLLSRLARLRGRTGEAARFERLSDEVRRAFQRELLDHGTGEVGNASQTAQSTALYHQLAPRELRPLVCERLVKAIHDRQHHVSSGIFGTKYMLDVLPRYGRSDLAYELATQPDFPGWGYMLNSGATTLWEHWRFSDDVFSHNHPMFGSVSEWMIRHVAGINVPEDATGCDRIEIRPQVVGDLTWAASRYRSVRGPVESSWRLTDDAWTLEVEAPVGATAKVWAPRVYQGELTESGSPLARAAGVTVVACDSDVVVIEVKSGRYRFAMKRDRNELPFRKQGKSN